MRNKFKILAYLFIGIIMYNCSEDDGGKIINIDSPTDVDAQFTIAQDNSGEVTITPTATSANSFIIGFGDGSGSSERITSGEQIVHVYDEGSYDVTIIAFNTNGESAEVTKTLEVSFLPPENLQVTITQDEENVTVEASADNATSYIVDFGDGSETVTFGNDETLEHEYTEEGTYTITVTANSGAQETAVYTEDVTIEIEEEDPNTDISIPLTFEGDPESYVFTEFEGAPTTVINNPDTNGNSSAQVAQTERVQGAANYAGAFIILDENPDLINNNQLTMKVWSPAAGIPVTLRFENPSNNQNGVEATVNTTVANQWETLTFNYSGVTAGQDITKMVIFFNLGTDGQGNIYYFDDIEYGEGDGGEDPGTGGSFTTIDFEGAPTSYAFTEFAGQPTQVVANPQMSGINTSAQVAESIKVAGAGNYAGAFLILDQEPDLTAATFNIKVWSPAAGIPIIFKFEDVNNPANGIENTQTTTVVNQWETLTFNLSGDISTGDYKKMIIYFNAGNTGQGNTYYFDDIEMQ